ncbi:HelD family protein [Actinocatenispora comari]|uniref:DNA helicase n=1 Tax=Actinocatenispora comari TaxID=2807577 RepID=A0A8J4A7E7_9ACTN|nr:AAA family ATPase [Actinocatenispora comari]GIL25575.1 DNA helicase [Actinocatenispora comari]
MTVQKTDPALDAELAAERHHLTSSRAALRRMRERAEGLYRTGDGVGGDPFAAESLGRALAQRIAELADDPDTPLFFGRLDHAEHAADGAAGEHTVGLDAVDTEHADNAGASFHIGRRHVVDDSGEPLVIDWRAPVSRAYYQASARQPMGVARRRRYGFAAGALTGFEDEHLTAGEELGTASRILTSEIERPRVGPMRDIVSTIQPEQDDLVRAELAVSLCVQGAPGTGKTAVGLHRAAFLLYHHREQLRRSGVLVVGPNAAFLGYIAAVLPALGEVGVDQYTVDALVAHAPVRAVDTPDAAAVKHDVRMARVLRRALYGQLVKPTESLVVSDGSARWRLSAEALRRIVDDARREGLPYATGRERVRARVASGLRRQAEARGESPGDTWLRRVGRSAPVREFLDSCWPAVDPTGLVVALLGDRELLATAADGILTDAEQDAIAWPRPLRTARLDRAPKAARLTTADNVLIDEAAGLIDRVGSYGHVVVDEAQDLSPMQCRAVARRSEHGSITVLGDLAQGTTPWAARRWPDSLAHLGKPDAEVAALTTGFRVPGAVLDLANRLVPALDVAVPAATSLRADGSLRLRRMSTVDDDLPDAVRDALAEEGSIGVIAPDAAVEACGLALAAAAIPHSTVDDLAAAERVVLVPATLAKGLEYDHVIVLEPADIVAAEPRGLHRLYVVLTRAVSRLVVLHSADLPPVLVA